MKNTTETLIRIGKQAGLSQQQVEDCLKDQALLDKIAADQKFAAEVLKVNSTPTFFINGEMVKGEQRLRRIQQAHQFDAEELIGSPPEQACSCTGQKYAEHVLKVAAATVFVNGDMIVGEAAFEEFDKRIKTLLKN